MARARLLTHDAIARAAFDLVDRDGPAALTINRLAAVLGVGPMTIYGYTPSKSEIVSLLPDVLLADLPALVADRPWQAQLAACFAAIHHRLLAHGEVTKLIATLPVLSETQRALHDEIIGLLRGAGFSKAKALTIHRALSAYTLGSALYGLSGRAEAVGKPMFRQGLQAVLDGFSG